MPAPAIRRYRASMQLRRCASMQLRRWRAWLRGRPLLADGLLALAVYAVSRGSLVVSGTVASGQTLWRPLDWLGYLLLAAGPLALVARRRWPVAAAAAVAVVLAVFMEAVLYGDTMVRGEPLYSSVAMLAAIWLGEAVRNRRAYVAELRDRAERAERTR